MNIINKRFLVLISGQNMNNIHLPGKLASVHNSTLVSEAEEEIQEIGQRKKKEKKERNPRGTREHLTVMADNKLGLGLKCDLAVKEKLMLF